jgi:uncharacterized protein YbjQ (UPF0145 family)
MIICTTSICQKFEVIDTVFVIHGEKAGGFLGSGGIDFNQGIDSVKAKLADKARGLGADAVIGVDFEQRVAPDAKWIEFFAYGTAVKIL